MFACSYRFFLTSNIIPIFSAHDCLKTFLLEVSGLPRPKLDTNDQFTIAQESN